MNLLFAYLISKLFLQLLVQKFRQLVCYLLLHSSFESPHQFFVIDLAFFNLLKQNLEVIDDCLFSESFLNIGEWLQKLFKCDSPNHQLSHTLVHYGLPNSDVGQIKHDLEGIFEFPEISLRKIQNWTVVWFQFKQGKSAQYRRLLILMEKLCNILAYPVFLYQTCVVIAELWFFYLYLALLFLVPSLNEALYLLEGLRLHFLFGRFWFYSLNVCSFLIKISVFALLDRILFFSFVKWVRTGLCNGWMKLNWCFVWAIHVIFYLIVMFFKSLGHVDNVVCLFLK